MSTEIDAFPVNNGGKQRWSLRMSRLKVVMAYLSGPLMADAFVSRYNSGRINKDLLKGTGTITAESLLRWAGKCLEGVEK